MSSDDDDSPSTLGMMSEADLEGMDLPSHLKRDIMRRWRVAGDVARVGVGMDADEDLYEEGKIVRNQVRANAAQESTTKEVINADGEVETIQVDADDLGDTTDFGHTGGGEGGKKMMDALVGSYDFLGDTAKFTREVNPFLLSNFNNTWGYGENHSMPGL